MENEISKTRIKRQAGIQCPWCDSSSDLKYGAAVSALITHD